MMVQRNFSDLWSASCVTMLWCNSPEICFDEAVDCHQKIISALLRPLLGDGEDVTIDILGVGHDIIGVPPLHHHWSHGLLLLHLSLVTKHLDWLIHLLWPSLNQHCSLIDSCYHLHSVNTVQCLLLLRSFQQQVLVSTDWLTDTLTLQTSLNLESSLCRGLLWNEFNLNYTITDIRVMML